MKTAFLGSAALGKYICTRHIVKHDDWAPNSDGEVHTNGQRKYANLLEGAMHMFAAETGPQTVQICAQ